MATVREARQIEKLVSEVLYWVWDPIGINDSFDSRDEYDGYALQVVSLLHGDMQPAERQKKIEALLIALCQDHIGVGGGQSKSQSAAERLMELANWHKY